MEQADFRALMNNTVQSNSDGNHRKHDLEIKSKKPRKKTKFMERQEKAKQKAISKEVFLPSKVYRDRAAERRSGNVLESAEEPKFRGLDFSVLANVKNEENAVFANEKNDPKSMKDRVLFTKCRDILCRNRKTNKREVAPQFQPGRLGYWYDIVHDRHHNLVLPSTVKRGVADCTGMEQYLSGTVSSFTFENLHLLRNDIVGKTNREQRRNQVATPIASRLLKQVAVDEEMEEDMFASSESNVKGDDTNVMNIQSLGYFDHLSASGMKEEAKQLALEADTQILPDSLYRAAIEEKEKNSTQQDERIEKRLHEESAYSEFFDNVLDSDDEMKPELSTKMESAKVKHKGKHREQKLEKDLKKITKVLIHFHTR